MSANDKGVLAVLKVFSVPVESICNVVVFAESEEDALRFATDSLDYGDFEMVNGGPAELIEDGEEDDARECYVRHADVIVSEMGRRIRKKEALARFDGGAA